MTWKEHILIVDPIMLEMNSKWDSMKNHPQTAKVSFFENLTAETEFLVFKFWGQFGSVFRKIIYPSFSSGSAHSYTALNAHLQLTSVKCNMYNVLTDTHIHTVNKYNHYPQKKSYVSHSSSNTLHVFMVTAYLLRFSNFNATLEIMNKYECTMDQELYT